MSTSTEPPRRRSLLIVAALVVLAVAFAAVYWFVIRDTDHDTGTDAESVGRGDQTFQVERVPFTFRFPANFAPAPTPEGFVWVAGIGPYDIIDVKRIANSERSLEKAATQTRATLEKRRDITIRGEGTETAGTTKMVRFSVDTAASGTALQSELYYFSMGGASWQVECQSTVEGRPEIAAACAQMLSTFAPR